MAGTAPSILTINGGSSSVKFAVFTAGDPPRRTLGGIIDRIGLKDSTLTAKIGDSGTADSVLVDAPSHERAARLLIDWLEMEAGVKEMAAVGHRVVHGGARYGTPQCVTPELLTELRRLIPIDRPHLPGEIALIVAFQRHAPNLPQIACFDTAFHRDMPRVAQLLPIPHHYLSAGLRRFGFHGISYTFLMQELARVAGAEAARGRVILAHLGNGASMAAVRDGKPVDTTMGFTPTAGLVMGTRPGDLDPGLLAYLMREERLNADQVDDLVNRRCGLLGVSGSSSDMRDLLAWQKTDPRAAEAVELFCYHVKKTIGAYAAALGGLDTLVFAGGIGEHAPEIRARACAGLEVLGIQIDDARNAAAAPVISADGSRATVRVMRTDEESMIAREVIRILQLGLPATG
jgi:acetate kinase